MPSVLAIAAHPDDIEFVMAGTMLQLRERGWDLHYFNLSRGDLGSTKLPPAQISQLRRREAQAGAETLGAQWHAPIGHDLQLFYTDEAIRKVCAVVREAQPTIVLTHALSDYMEDHMITARLAVTATFARGIPHYRSHPARRPTLEPCVIYHAMPHGLKSPMREPVLPEAFVDTTSVHALKREALACHASQKEWLDATQGMDSYLVSMDETAAQLGKMSRKFRSAEGWRRHQHLGFSTESHDPLAEALGKAYHRLKKKSAK